MNAEQIKYSIARRRSDYSSSEIQCYESYLLLALKKSELMAYDLPYPKHRFLSYLTDEKNYLAHGSPLNDLALLKPIRKSKDTEETGHEKLLLAASDAIWAMWFAILDKSCMGSLTSNDCFVKTLKNREIFSLYYFSVGHEAINDQPYQSGAVYILEPDVFVHSQGEERGSKESVCPLFKVDIDKYDFPYLPYVKGIDAEALMRAMKEKVRDSPWLSDKEVFPVSPEIPDELTLPIND